MTDVLAIMAHPDDAELLCGGVLLRSSDLGYRTGIIDLTGGEAGSQGDASTRAAETQRASRILQLSVRRNANLPDGALAPDHPARMRVAGLIRELRPRTVVLHWPEARHPDHRAASLLAHEACFLAGLGRAQLDGTPHRPTKVLYALSFREDHVKPTFVVDITDQIERKIEAIQAYESQVRGRFALGDIFGGGNRPLIDQIRMHAAHYGSLIRRPYGEPYWTRETMQVDDVVALPVGSF